MDGLEICFGYRAKTFLDVRQREDSWTGSSFEGYTSEMRKTGTRASLEERQGIKSFVLPTLKLRCLLDL